MNRVILGEKHSVVYLSWNSLSTYLIFLLIFIQSFEISQGDLSAGEKSEDNRVECQLYQVDLSDPNMDPVSLFMHIYRG